MKLALTAHRRYFFEKDQSTAAIALTSAFQTPYSGIDIAITSDDFTAALLDDNDQHESCAQVFTIVVLSSIFALSIGTAQALCQP